ncbi:MAG: DUF6391 domain-containing protein [Microcoleaceae cyanobacterium]
MTTTATNTSSLFDFVPDANWDQELLSQLSFLPGLQEILTVRQVHALEHATVWVLSEAVGSGHLSINPDTLGGMSTESGFYLYGPVNITQLRQAVQIALTRLTQGEWNLAVHPRCGTNLSVGMLLTGGLALGINFLLPKGPIEQLLGIGIATTAATQLAPDVGSLTQRYLTTAIPFNIQVDQVSVKSDMWGRSAHFVQVSWVEDATKLK